MDPRRRLLHYLLINIFVSALVTGTILFFYHRIQQANCSPVRPLSTSPSSSTSVNVNIDGVIGVGTIAEERLIVHNVGSSSIVLTGWYLQDAKGVSYTFPQVTLFPGGKIQVHSQAGSNDATNLYWGRSSSMWVSGELAVLYDSQNIARAFYRIP